MTKYKNTIRSQVESFVQSLKNEFYEEYDYIEGIDSDSSDGLDHLDAYDEDVFNENPLEIRISFGGIDLMSMEEFESLDNRVTAFADEEGIAVESTAGNGDYVEYTFYMHSAFLDVAK